MPDSARQRPLFIPALLLALLFLTWQLPGLIGRSPWKSDEAYTMGLVFHVLETGDLVVPTLAGEPFLQKPPLFFVIAAGFAKLFSPMVPLHVGARSASLLFNLVTLLFLGLASRELNGKGRGWPAAVLFLCCLGPLHMAHFILTDLALLSGVALSLYGMALGLRRPWAGGFVCGAGAGLGFMAKGLLGCGLPGVAVLLLPCLDSTWRNKNWLRFVCACVISALPWATIWPAALFLRSPQLFSEWIVDNNFGRFHAGLAHAIMAQLETAAKAMGRLAPEGHLQYHDVGGPKSWHGYMLVLLPWYAFPASALAAWGLWREGRQGWRTPTLRVPLIFLIGGLLVFTASSDGREIYALPLTAPLLLMAARAIDAIKPAFVRAANGIIFVFFSTLAILLWLGWIAVQMEWPSSVHQFMRARLPGFEPTIHFWALDVALVATAAWVILIWKHRTQAAHLAVHAAAGVALLYLLSMTIYLPMADWNMSYQRQFEPLRAVLPPPEVPVASRGLEEPQRAMLHYYAGLKTLRKKSQGSERADWLLTQSLVSDPEDRLAPGNPWKCVWQTTHNKEKFRLYRRPER